MSLVRAERRRLIKRRFTRYMLLIGLIILGAVAGGVALTNSKPGPDSVAEAQARVDAEYTQQLQYWESGGKAQCEAAAKNSPDAKGPIECTGPRKEDFQVEWFLPPSFDFKSEFPPMITVWAAIMALVAFIVGASYVGAEWNSGGMMNLLLWRPRRGVVLSAKLGTLLAGTAVGSAVVGALWTVAFWFIAVGRGTTEGMTSGVWQSFGLTGLRGLALVLFAATIGFTLASLGRHTAMALGVAAAVIVVFQFGVGVLLSLAQVPFVEAYLLPTHMIAWMQKEIVLENWQSCDFSAGECKPETMTLSWVDTGTAATVVLALLVAAAYWSMTRRDVA